MSLYLGLDLSTQTLTGVVLEVAGSRREIVYQQSLSFDADFPGYGTQNGILPQDDPLVATSSPLLWAAALDRFMDLLATESGLDLTDLRAISGAAQQHGSVYLNATAGTGLGHLDARRPLADQVRGMLSREDAPTWMDSSTAVECAEITTAVGGDHALARITGSRAFERFTGPQIRKFQARDPVAYAATDRIHLISSYVASLLTGRHAPIDHGDGAGMNLMDLSTRRWSDVALRATAPDLDRKLPDLEPSSVVISRLSPYWIDRFRFPPAKVVAWTGDNPSSLIGVGLVHPRRIAISLGTSDTLFGILSEPRVDPSGTGHVFGAPTGDYMALVCFKNGSLARERVRDAYGLDWKGFSAALRNTPPGNRGAIMLPWFAPEITPPVLTPAVHRYGLDAADGPANIRAAVEAQMMATAIHSAWMERQVESIHATGGAARNGEILQVMADVHNADVYRCDVNESAALGAALRAFHGDQTDEGRRMTWDEIVAGVAEPAATSRVRPVAEHAALYAELKKVYAACEAHALGQGPAPIPVRDSGADRSRS